MPGRPLSRILLKCINGDDFQQIDLLDLKLVGQDPAQTIHVTSAGQKITWRGIDYFPIGMNVGNVDERAASSAGEAPAITVSITNVDRQMAKLLSAVELDGAEATLWRTDRRVLTDRGPMQLTIGEVREVSLTDSVLTFQILTAIGQTERITIPRRSYQSHCNYVFGEPACSVNIHAAPITLTSTVQAGSIRNFIVIPTSLLTAAGSPADPSDFWDQGTVWLTDGPAGLQAKPFQRYELFSGQHRFWLRDPLLTIPNAGDPFTVRRACRKTPSDCQMYQGNLLNYGGFRDVPPIRFKPVTVSDY